MTLPAVEPIMGAPFKWYVASRSQEGARHVVDWLDDPPSCSCNAYAMNIRRSLQEGKPYVCHHMQSAKEHCWRELIENVRDQIAAQ